MQTTRLLADEEEIRRRLPTIVGRIRYDEIKEHRRLICLEVGMRRSHRKSHGGCKKCKERHTKCDEQHPRCGNCTRLGFECSFSNQTSQLDKQHTASNRSAGVAPSLTLSENNSQLFDILDLELLQNLNNGLLVFLSPDIERQYCTEFVQIGLQNLYVLHSMLAVSALHLLHTMPDRAGLKDKALSHYSKALELVQPHLSEPTQAHAIPLFLYSLYINVYGYGVSGVPGLNRTGRTDGSVMEDPLDELSVCFRLSHGLRVIVYQYWQSTIIHFLLPKMTRPLVRPGTTPDYSRSVPLTELRKLVESQAAEEVKQVCIEAVDDLTLFYLETADQAISERSTQWIQSWPVTVADDFIRLIDGHDRMALIITAHYAALMNLQGSVWWLKHWPKALLTQIEQLVGPATALECLQWPREMVYST